MQADTAATTVTRKVRKPPLHVGMAFLALNGNTTTPETVKALVCLAASYHIPDEAQRPLIEAFLLYVSNYAPTDAELIGRVIAVAVEWGLAVPYTESGPISVVAARQLLIGSGG